MPHWVSTKEKLPEEDMEVLVYIKYEGKFKCPHICMMYRTDNQWHFSGSNTIYNGKYIKYWLDDLNAPEGEPSWR